MLITSNLSYKQQHFIASYNILLVSSILAVYRKLCLAFLIQIERLTILRRPPQAILRLYRKIFYQMQLMIMFEDMHYAGLHDKCQDLPSNTQKTGDYT